VEPFQLSADYNIADSELKIGFEKPQDGSTHSYSSHLTVDEKKLSLRSTYSKEVTERISIQTMLEINNPVTLSLMTNYLISQAVSLSVGWQVSLRVVQEHEVKTTQNFIVFFKYFTYQFRFPLTIASNT
jgi:hypothetical protein